MRCADICTLLAELSLIELHVSILAEDKLENRPLQSSTLRSLEIHGTPSALLPLLAVPSLPNVECARLSLFDDSDERVDLYSSEMVKTIVAAFFPTSLRTLEIMIGEAFTSRTPRCLDPISILHVLRPCFRLERIES